MYLDGLSHAVVCHIWREKGRVFREIRSLQSLIAFARSCQLVVDKLPGQTRHAMLDWTWPVWEMLLKVFAFFSARLSSAPSSCGHGGNLLVCESVRRWFETRTRICIYNNVSVEIGNTASLSFAAFQTIRRQSVQQRVECVYPPSQAVGDETDLSFARKCSWLAL
ncbi:unnamed protein product [Protopolystoma xenopodis]|uniref:Uncharacterized protein n=1 Tax=Protopolystoma xenopodis TaxID=117903 RepID=A0A3S5CH80_9PLAT|nr:unnamed protein product [Protopolystoma xenopodis]